MIGIYQLQRGLCKYIPIWITTYDQKNLYMDAEVSRYGFKHHLFGRCYDHGKPSISGVDHGDSCMGDHPWTWAGTWWSLRVEMLARTWQKNWWELHSFSAHVFPLILVAMTPPQIIQTVPPIDSPPRCCLKRHGHATSEPPELLRLRRSSNLPVECPPKLVSWNWRSPTSQLKLVTATSGESVLTRSPARLDSHQKPWWTKVCQR